MPVYLLQFQFQRVCGTSENVDSCRENKYEKVKVHTQKKCESVFPPAQPENTENTRYINEV